MTKRVEIVFKSNPINFIREATGTKSNTIRKPDQDGHDARFRILDKYIQGEKMNLYVGIQHTKLNETFFRKVSDVTKFEGLYIISWRI